MYDRLFETFEVKGLKLKNRLIMAPLYLGYAAEGGSVSTLLLEHYRLMAQSGVALVVVENSTIDSQRGSGSGEPETLFRLIVLMRGVFSVSLPNLESIVLLSASTMHDMSVTMPKSGR